MCHEHELSVLDFEITRNNYYSSRDCNASSCIQNMHLWAVVLFHALCRAIKLPVSPLSQRERGGLMGPRSACSSGNVTPHLWAWPAACSPYRMMRGGL